MPSRTTAIPVSLLLMTALIYPVLEEFVFRSGIQGALLSNTTMARSLGGISLACVVTSILFAAAHLFRQPPMWAALVFFPSLIFGWSRERFDSLLPPILLHIIYNAGFISLFQVG